MSSFLNKLKRCNSVNNTKKLSFPANRRSAAAKRFYKLAQSFTRTRRSSRLVKSKFKTYRFRHTFSQLLSLSYRNFTVRKAAKPIVVFTEVRAKKSLALRWCQTLRKFKNSVNSATLKRFFLTESPVFNKYFISKRAARVKQPFALLSKKFRSSISTPKLRAHSSKKRVYISSRTSMVSLPRTFSANAFLNPVRFYTTYSKNRNPSTTSFAPKVIAKRYRNYRFTATNQNSGDKLPFRRNFPGSRSWRFYNFVKKMTMFYKAFKKPVLRLRPFPSELFSSKILYKRARSIAARRRRNKMRAYSSRQMKVYSLFLLSPYKKLFTFAFFWKMLLNFGKKRQSRRFIDSQLKFYRDTDLFLLRYSERSKGFVHSKFFSSVKRKALPFYFAKSKSVSGLLSASSLSRVSVGGGRKVRLDLMRLRSNNSRRASLKKVLPKTHSLVRQLVLYKKLLNTVKVGRQALSLQSKLRERLDRHSMASKNLLHATSIALTLLPSLTAPLFNRTYRINKKYKRVYLRRRMRASNCLRRRIRRRRALPLRWPVMYEIGRPRPKYTKRSYWRRRRFLEKGRRARLKVSRIFRRSSEKLSFIPKADTSLASFMRIRSLRRRFILSKTPAYAMVYKLRLRRWHSYRDSLGNPLPRTWASRAEKRRLARINHFRRRRGLRPKKRPDPVYRELEVSTGSATSLGYRRKRRVFQSKFSTTRWWKPNTLANPTYNSVDVASLRASRFNLASLKPVRKTTQDLIYFRNAAKRSGLRRFGKELAPLRRKLLESSNSWRLIENNNDASVKALWSLNKLHEVISCVSKTHFPELWSRSVAFLGLEQSQRLRSLFTKQSSLWLEDRYSERKFLSKISLLGSKVYSVGTKNLIILNRQKLFRTSPNWWAEEALRRLQVLNSLFTSLSTNNANSLTLDTILAKLRTAVIGSFSASDTIAYEQEKALLTFTLARLPLTEKESLIKNFTHTETEYLALAEKGSSSAYQFWLRGIERFTKKSVQSQSSLSRNDFESRSVTLLGTERPRFPGTGRRVNSYDRALRLFYRKTTPSRFRRVQRLRFKWLRPSMFSGFYSRTPKFYVSGEQRRSSRYALQLNGVRYLPRAWRRLVNYRKVNKALRSFGYSDRFSTSLARATGKRRLQKLPLELESDNVLNAALTHRSFLHDATLEPLLISAIKSRLKSRRLQDLALHISRRLLPQEQILPPWMAARKRQKRNKLRGKKSGMYFLPGRYESSTEARWALSRFNLVASSRRPKRIFKTTAEGELLLEPKRISIRSGFSKGFALTRPARKIRRFRKRRRYKGILLKQKRKNKSRKVIRRAKRRKKRSIFSFRLLKRLAVTRLHAQKAKLSRKFSSYAMRSARNSFSLVPVHFAKPAYNITVSENEKRRQKEGLEALKQAHYKKTSYIAASITKLFPQLISLILSRQGFTKSLNSAAVRGMIRAVYWSLRFYLQSDHGGRRLAARDLSRNRFNLLRNQIFTDVDALYFGASDFKLMRQRFQPHRLHAVRISNRRAVDWLRMFFPRYHSLYLEDSEEYKNFFLTPTKVMRAHPSRKAPGKWSSHKLFGSMESRFKRLTNNTSLENSSRFENILMTSRRSPVIPGRWGFAALRSGSFINASTTSKSSFFRRQYSTSLFRNSSFLPVVADRVVITQRQSASQAVALTDFQSLRLKQSLKPRSYSKNRSSYAESGSDIGLGSIDPRFFRLKSPRNRQFIQRGVNAKTNKALTIYHYNLYKNSLFKKGAADTKVGLHSRKLQRFSLRPHPVAEYRFLNARRSSFVKRRIVSLLRTRLAFLQKPVQSFRSIFSSRARVSCYNKIQAQKVFSPKSLTAFLQTDRSILHSRAASQRLNTFSFIKPNLLPSRSVVLKPVVSKFLVERGLSNSISQKILKWRSAGAADWFRRKSFNVAASEISDQKNGIAIAPFKTRNVYSPFSGITLKKYNYSRVRYFARLKSKLTLASRSVKKNLFFFSQAKILRKNAKLVSSFLVKEQKRSLVNLGALRRHELWGEISLPWMKKRRILKNWLKTAKRGLKKDNWAQMAQVLFKGMRVRLRKLEWREPDRHFNRRGWRNAFSFYPNERKKAPWLERLMFRRSLFFTMHGPYRRYQFPREQKRLKWLQQYRKTMLSSRGKKYIRKRRWPKLRIYNQRLHRGLFSLRNTRVAQRRFKKLSRQKPKGSGFSKSLTGLADRLDVNLVLLNIAPTVFWAKVLAKFGIFRINNSVVCDPAYRFKKNDRIFWNWTLIERLRDHFQKPLRHYENQRIKNASASFPKNFIYFSSIRTAIYKGLPRPEDLQKNGRLTPFLFKMFQADAGLGK